MGNDKERWHYWCVWNDTSFTNSVECGTSTSEWWCKCWKQTIQDIQGRKWWVKWSQKWKIEIYQFCFPCAFGWFSMIGCFFVAVVTEETLAQWKADAEFVDVEFSPDPAEGMWPRMGETQLGCPSEIQLDFIQEGNPVTLNMELNTDLLEQEHSAVNFGDGTETKADTVSISITLWSTNFNKASQRGISIAVLIWTKPPFAEFDLLLQWFCGWRGTCVW